MESLALRAHYLRTVFHVGTLAAADRGRRESYEGNALSVSSCPDAWRSIARCSGEVFLLRSPEPKPFLSMHDVKPAALTRILRWAQTEKLVEPIKVFRAWSTGEEGESRFSEYRTLKEAIEEGTRVSTVSGWAGNTELVRARGLQAIPIGESAVDFAVMTFAERSGFAGVWWNETYDPANLSAPRGAIFRSALQTWRATLSPAYDDECLLDAFPRTQPITIAIPALSPSLAMELD